METIVKKIPQPKLPTTKNEVTKICNEPGKRHRFFLKWSKIENILGNLATFKIPRHLMLLSAHLTSNDFNGRQLLFMTPYIEHDVIRHVQYIKGS